MKPHYITKIQCQHNGVTGSFLTDLDGNLITKIYPDAYSLFTSEEYRLITK